MGRRSKLFPIFDWQRALRDSDLAPMTKAVGLVLSTYVNDKGENAHPGEALIAEKLAPMTTRTVRTHLSRLRDAGFIERYIHGSTAEHRNWADVYRISLPTTGSQDPVIGGDHRKHTTGGLDGARTDHRKSETRPPENRSTDHRKLETPQHPIASPHTYKASAPRGAASRASARGADDPLHYGDVWTGDDERVDIVFDALGGFPQPGEEPAIRNMLDAQRPLAYIVNTIRSGSADPAA